MNIDQSTCCLEVTKMKGMHSCAEQYEAVEESPQHNLDRKICVYNTCGYDKVWGQAKMTQHYYVDTGRCMHVPESLQKGVGFRMLSIKSTELQNS